MKKVENTYKIDMAIKERSIEIDSTIQAAIKGPKMIVVLTTVKY